MEFLKAYIGNLQSTKRKSHQHRKSATKQRMISPSVCSDPSVIDDLQRLSGYLKEQISMVETCSQSHELLESSSYSSSCNPYLVHVCTSYLPNYLWYQPIAADATTIMRPTSLCSGTGITGKSQYLQPDMLRVFRMFGSYLVGSGHLFREEEEDERSSTIRVCIYDDLPFGRTFQKMMEKTRIMMMNPLVVAAWSPRDHIEPLD